MTDPSHPTVAHRPLSTGRAHALGDIPCLLRTSFTCEASRSYWGSMFKLGEALFDAKWVTRVVFT